MQITDVSPQTENTTLLLGGQEVAGQVLCVAISSDGSRVYIGGHSGVWRSDDHGANWRHLEWPQPPAGSTAVPGCLSVPTIFDLAVSPANPDIVLVATGPDARYPGSLSGIYRSTDGGANWTRVHVFQQNGKVAPVGTLSMALDNPQLIFAAGQFAVAMSNDGGATWTEVAPHANTDFWHVAVARAEGTQRRVYAVGSAGVWYSSDAGAHWSASASGPALGMPFNSGATVSARALSINPLNPAIVYIAHGLNSDDSLQLAKGDFTAFPSTGTGRWTVLPSPPREAARTPSGATYVVAHAGPSGQLYLTASDEQWVHLSVGEPANPSAWIWIDQTHHWDPHGLAVTANFERGAAASSASGTMFAINDGGVYISSDGARTWTKGNGLSTLAVVNSAICPRPGKPPAICIGTTHNAGFYTQDGGAHWKSQEYDGGDNDCCFADPALPNWLLVFAPRGTSPDPTKMYWNNVRVYSTSGGNVPDAAIGTHDNHEILGPAKVRVRPDGASWGWNAVSWWYNLGYRPLVLTLPGQKPRPDGDFITIHFLENSSLLLRTTALSQITSANDWTTSATSEGLGVKVFQVGPTLPDMDASAVQASGGHDSPVFYVSDSEVPGNETMALHGQQRLWKWTAGMSAWQLLIPGNKVTPPVGAPGLAQRFFVDPYRPGRIYVLDKNHVWRSEDGGSHWNIETSLENNLTQNGAFPFDFTPVNDGTAQAVLLRDMNFDPVHTNYRFAVGPAGVFYTRDGTNWDHLLLSSASGIQPSNSTYDSVSDSCNRSLYVSTTDRGLLRLSPLPPDWDFPIGSLQEVSGRIQFLRVNDVGTGYGPQNDFIDAEVIFQLDSQPEKAFGFQLRTDGDRLVNRGKLNLLRLAYAKNLPFLVDFTRTSCHNGTVLRVALQ